MKSIVTAIAALLMTGAAWAAGAVNVNKASAEELADSLKGIGPSKAQSIVEYREANGSFLHVDELVNVKGIGIRTVDQNRDLIRLNDDDSSAGE